MKSRSRARRLRRLDHGWGARAIAAALLVGVVSWMIWLVGVAATGFDRDVDGNVLGVDQSIFHAAGRLVSDGRASQLYDPEALATELADVRNEPRVGAVDFLNPPAMAFLFVPTSALPQRVAYLGLAGVGITALYAAMKIGGVTRWGRAGSLVLASVPGLIALRLGQMAFIWVLVLSIVYYFLELDKQAAAGMVGGFLAVKPHLIVPMALWWLIRYRQYRRAFWSLAATLAVVSTASFMAAPGALGGYLRAIRGSSIEREFPAGYSLVDAMTGLIPALSPWVAIAVSVAIATGVIVVVARRLPRDQPAQFAAVLFATLLMSPHFLIYDWALIGLGAALLWEARPLQREGWAIVGGILGVWAWLAWVGAVWVESAVGVTVQPAAIGLLIIGLYAYRTLLREPRTAVNPGQRIMEFDV